MTAERRNPGPSWGYALIRLTDRVLPNALFMFFVGLGTAVALPLMRRRARHSREFLSRVLGRSVGWTENWRHFYRFSQFLVLRLRVAGGAPHACIFRSGDPADFEYYARSPSPVLFGTFHLGQSDLLGFWLADNYQRSVRMVRHQVGNSDDLRWLDQRFGQRIGYIWVNDPAELLWAFKEALAGNHSIAMKCDRGQYSARHETFRFLGREEAFPFTIYHLGIALGLPVVFAFGVPDGPERTAVSALPAFVPDDRPRAKQLGDAKAHFARVLAVAEELVRADPYLWFNFEPLNLPREAI